LQLQKIRNFKVMSINDKPVYEKSLKVCMNPIHQDEQINSI
jgi:hypothetical protein